MKTKRRFFRFFGLNLIIGCMAVASVSAQQDAEYSMYMFNGLYLNPAYSGSKEVIDMTALYRHQWTSVEGAPKSVSVGAHTPLKKEQYAIGLSLTNDNIGLSNMFSTYVSYAYRVKIGKQAKFSAGVQAGFTQYSADLIDAELPDPGLADQTYSFNRDLFLPNFGFGIYIYSTKYYFGASVPHLINNSLNEKLEAAAANNDVARQYKHYLLTAGYVFDVIKDKLKLKPSALMKFVQPSQLDFDLNLSALYDERYWLGFSYRTGGDAKNRAGDALIVIAEFLATPQLRVGYAYDYNLSKLRKHNSGTHELMVGYQFGFKATKFVSPRYVSYF